MCVCKLSSEREDEHVSTMPYSGQYGFSWWRGVVASVVRRMNEVTLRRARLVLGWVTVFGRYVTSQLGQLSLASLRGR